MKYYCIDRIESDFAVCECEDGSMANIPLSLLPPGAKEGQWISQDSSGCFSLDPERTSREKAKARSLLDRLFGRSHRKDEIR